MMCVRRFDAYKYLTHGNSRTWRGSGANSAAEEMISGIWKTKFNHCEYRGRVPDLTRRLSTGDEPTASSLLMPFIVRSDLRKVTSDVTLRLLGTVCSCRSSWQATLAKSILGVRPENVTSNGGCHFPNGVIVRTPSALMSIGFSNFEKCVWISDDVHQILSMITTNQSQNCKWRRL